MQYSQATWVEKKITLMTGLVDLDCPRACTPSPHMSTHLVGVLHTFWIFPQTLRERTYRLSSSEYMWIWTKLKNIQKKLVHLTRASNKISQKAKYYHVTKRSKFKASTRSINQHFDPRSFQQICLLHEKRILYCKIIFNN